VGAVALAAVLTMAARKSSAGGERSIRAVRGDLVSEIEFSGALKAVDSSILSPPPIPDVWEFKIVSLATEGSDIRKGTPVIAFDTSALVRELEQKKAERDSAASDIEKTTGDLSLQREKDAFALAEAEARLRKIALKLEVPGELVATNDRRLSEIDGEIARKEIEYLREKAVAADQAARERLAALRTQEKGAADGVRDTEQRIAQMALKAPRDGTVIYTTDWRGEKRKVGDSTWRGRPIVEIPDLSTMFGAGEVDEPDAGRVALGQPVRLRLDAHPDDEFTGRIARFAKAVGRRSPKNPLKVLQVEVRLDRTDRGRMRPGMRFRGIIERERIRGAVLLPLEAVVTAGGRTFVLRHGLGSTTRVPVETGARNSRFVQIVRGLSPGDSVRLSSGATPGG